MKPDNHTLALIAVGASVSANCQPCLERNLRTALKCGADFEEITEAIEIGKRVRQGAASKMDTFAAEVHRAVYIPTTAIENPCECSKQGSSFGGDNG